MDQDIIEKRPSSPLGTSLLVIAFVCLCGACSFLFMEINELQGDAQTAEAHASSVASSAKKTVKAFDKLLDSELGLLPEDEDDDEEESDSDEDDEDSDEEG